MVLTMEVDASDLDEAYEIMDDLYTHLAVDNIYHSALVAWKQHLTGTPKRV